MIARLAALDDAAVSPTAKLLNEPDEATRVAAVLALGQMRAIAAGRALMTALPDASADVRVAAATHLGARHGPALHAELLHLAESGPRDAATAAVYALQKSADPRAGPALVTLLGTAGSGAVRGQAAESLGLRREPGAFEPLLARLADAEVCRGPLLNEYRGLAIGRSAARRAGLAPGDDRPDGPGAVRVCDVAATALVRLTGRDCGVASAELPRDADRLRACWRQAGMQPASATADPP
ncbi:MAG: HEAT repeat domain-containing protein [Phycisphaerae bacterium]